MSGKVFPLLVLLLIAGFKILRGTQRLFSVKYLCGEAKNCLEFSIAYQAEKGLKFLDVHSGTNFKAYLTNSLLFSKV